MKTLSTIATVLFVLTLIPSICLAMGPRPDAPVPPGSSGKAGSPIEVSIAPATIGTEPGTEITPGATVELVVTVSSSMASDNVSVTLKLTGGAELVSGDTGWALSLGKGDEDSRVITVRFPGHPGGKVTVRASIDEGPGGKYSARASIRAGNDNDKPAETGRSAVDGSGREIIEYRAE